MFHEYAMARWTTAIVGAWLIAALSPSAQPTGGSLDDLRRLFADPPPESRILMRWWWFGSAVTTPELEREMRAMREAGMRLRDHAYPMVAPSDPSFRDVNERRRALEELLQVNVSATATFKASVAILAPLFFPF